MLILSRYVVRRYSVDLALSLIALVAIFLVVDLTDRLSTFLDRAFDLRTIVSYYLFYVPYVAVLALPMASLLACLFAIGQLSRHGELSAMKAAGLGLGRILAPLVGTALAISLVALLVADRAVPPSNRHRVEIERGGAMEVPYFTVRENLVLRDINGQVLSIGRYDVSTKVAYTVALDRYEDDRLVSRVTAETLRWNGSRWEWRNGIQRRFVGASEISEPFASGMAEDLALRPEDLERPDRKPEEMSYAELSRSIGRRRLNGMPVRKELVELHMKIAFPLAALVMALFGAPLSSSLPQTGRGATFGLCLLLSFVYYGSIRGCQALGWNGLLSPSTSAWLPNAVFACVGLVLYLRAHK